jgi:hypothetical protein
MTFQSGTEPISNAEKVSLRQGESLTLSCSSTGVPLPTISWSVNGQIVNFDRIDQSTEPSLFIHTPRYTSATLGIVNSTIRIEDIQYLADDGVYLCTGSIVHAGGEDTSSASLIVDVLGMLLWDRRVLFRSAIELLRSEVDPGRG